MDQRNACPTLGERSWLYRWWFHESNTALLFTDLYPKSISGPSHGYLWYVVCLFDDLYNPPPSQDFIVFSIFLYPCNYNHISLIHLAWKRSHTTKARFTKTVCSWGRRMFASSQNTQKKGFAMVGQAPPQHQAIGSFRCGVFACFGLFWVLFLLYWFSVSVRSFDFFVCLFNPYNIGIFQASSQIKPLETYELHIKTLIAQ